MGAISSISLRINRILTILMLMNTPTLSRKSGNSNPISIALNDDDPFRISQEFLTVQIDETRKHEDLSLSSCLSANVPIHTAMDVCGDTESLTNLFVYTGSDEEFARAIWNITEQADRLRQTTNPGFRFYCRIFIVIRSCNETLSLRAEDFLRDSSEERVTPLPFNWKSDLYLVQFCENTSTSNRVLKIWEVYSVKNTVFTKFLARQSTVMEEKRLVVNLTQFSLAHLNTPKVVRRHDLDGINITAALFVNKENEDDNPYEFKLGKGPNGEDTLVSGFSVSIFRDFMNAMNFTENILKIYFNLENYFGTAFESKEYQFDINIFHTGVTKNRTKVARPLHPTFFDGVHAIFIQPSDRSVRNIYRKPFGFQMWSVLFYTWTCIFLCCKLTTYLHSKLEASYQQDPEIQTKHEQNYVITDDSEEEPNYSTFEALLWCIGTLCQQGWHNLPSSSSTRLIIATGLLLSVVCYAAYTGKIVSELWDVPKPIKSLDQLLSYADKVYLISASDTSNDILEGLQESSPEVLKKVRFRDVETIYRKIREHPGKACSIAWPDSVYEFAEEEYAMEHGEGVLGKIDAYICDTFHSFNFQASSALFVPKFSELEQLFNYRIVFGLERGFIRRYWNTYVRQTKLFCLRNNPKVTTLGFNDVFFAFFTLWSGMVLCGVMLVLELLVHRVWVRVPVV